MMQLYFTDGEMDDWLELGLLFYGYININITV